MNLLLPCLLTVLIETPFLALCGIRDREGVVIVVCANVVTNLALNLILSYALPGWDWRALLCAEALVVAAEYAVYAKAFGASARLLGLTFAANALSCGLGLLLYSLW